MSDATAADRPEEHAKGNPEGYGSFGYRTYVLNALLLIYILNFVDRSLLSVVARPLKAELGISDTAFGVLTGFGFALLYTFVGIPLARVAERRNRVIIMSICIALWSIMTALCGLAKEVTIFGAVIGGFWVLLVCRVGVGIGEAGCTPPASSLISDYFPPGKRSSAMGYYAMGVTLGSLGANLVAGPVADAFGWRYAFFILGIPGVLIALLFFLTVKEPPRGYSDPPGTIRVERASLKDGLQELFSKASYWWMVAAATMAAFCGYAIGAFQSLYVQRTFDLTAGQAALQVNVPSFAAGAVGTFVLGWIAGRIKSPSAIAWLAAAGLALSIPAFGLAFTTSSMLFCVIGLSVGNAVKYGYLAAQYTIAAGVVSMRVRATSTAILLFVVNLLGYGLGPLFAGLVSDFWFARSLAEAGYADTVTRSMCDAAQQATTFAQRAAENVLTSADITGIVEGLKAPLSLEQYQFCLAANQSSTSTSMLTLTALYGVASVLFVMCAFPLKREMIGHQSS